jgi:glycosyltransferase involved in cell wall biosynthesis
MHAADVLLMTSDTEGVPGVVLEAGAASLPVVATRVGGVAECLADGVAGLLAEADDETALAKHCVRLLRDEFGRRKMGIEGRCRVARDYTVETVAREFLAFYRTVLDAAPDLDDTWPASPDRRPRGRATAQRSVAR